MDISTREFVRLRANKRCEYCKLPEEVDDWPFHLEHLIARQHGGGDDPENLCWSCSRCNLHKGPNLVSIDFQTGRQANLFNPRTQSWQDHFVLQDGRIMGLTPAGRATVRLMKMNDPWRVELRRELGDETFLPE